MSDIGLVVIKLVPLKEERRLQEYLKQEDIHWCGWEFASVSGRTATVRIAAAQISKAQLCTLSSRGFALDFDPR